MKRIICNIFGHTPIHKRNYHSDDGCISTMKCSAKCKRCRSKINGSGKVRGGKWYWKWIVAILLFQCNVVNAQRNFTFITNNRNNPEIFNVSLNDAILIHNIVYDTVAAQVYLITSLDTSIDSRYRFKTYDMVVSTRTSRFFLNIIVYKDNTARLHYLSNTLYGKIYSLKPYNLK